MKIQQNKGTDNIKNNHNENILSTIKVLPSKTISLSFNKDVDKPFPSESNLINSSDFGKKINNTNSCSNSLSNNCGSILNSISQNTELRNNIEHNPIFERYILPNYCSFNYFFNISPLYLQILNQQNYYPLNYNINNYNFSEDNKNCLINNPYLQFHDFNEENTLLNKKRFSDGNIYNSKIEQNNLLNNKNHTIEKSKINLVKKEEKKKNYNCKHSGCDSLFRTKKLAFYHHLKMSPECQEDSISLLKLIYETKKVVLKNIDKNTNSLDKYSSLYENSLKNLSFYGYIKMYTGSKLNDNL